MKVAIIHEWFDTLAGSEKVVEQFLECYPEADVYALVDFLADADRAALKGKPVQTSFIQRLPFARKLFRNLLPLMPAAIEQFDLAGYDTLISSNHAVAKGVIKRPDQMHVCYIHNPIRYAWEMQYLYLRQCKLRGLKGALTRAILHYLRLWDRLAADRVDAFVANSHYVARRVHNTYRRPAHVIHPPVDTNAFSLHADKEDFYVTASRLVPHKRIDLIVEAFARMPGRKLVVIGHGPEYERIAAKATSNVTMLGCQPFEVLRDHMQRARAFIFASEEEFGIIPVEAQACGTPVIAYGRGGVLETVVNGRTGLLFDRQTPQCIRETVEWFDWAGSHIHPEAVRAHAEGFAADRFRREMEEFVDRLWTRFRQFQTDHRSACLVPFPLDQIIHEMSPTRFQESPTCR